MEELARKNLELAQLTFGDGSLPVATALHQLGEAQLHRGEQEQAESSIQEALRIRRKLLGNEHLDVARTLCRLGRVLHALWKTPEAQAAYREGLAICQRHPGGKSLVEAELLPIRVIREIRGLPQRMEPSGMIV